MNDQTLLNQIQYTVIEDPDYGQTWNSGLWSRDEVIDYIIENQDKFIKNTHIIVSTGTVNITAGTSRYTLPSDWVNTVRVYWRQASSTTRKPLARSDSWEADHGIPTWPNTQAAPRVYMDGDTPPLTIQVAPLPSTNGTIEVQYIAEATAVDGNGTALTVQDEFASTVKYGVLADMFGKVGRANDPSRAEYCNKRFQMGVEIAQILLKGFSDSIKT